MFDGSSVEVLDVAVSLVVLVPATSELFEPLLVPLVFVFLVPVLVEEELLLEDDELDEVELVLVAVTHAFGLAATVLEVEVLLYMSTARTA